MLDFARLVTLAYQKRAIKKLVLSRPTSDDAPLKIAGRLAMRRGRPILTLERTLRGNTVSQQNVTEAELSDVLTPLFTEYRQVNLLTHLGDAEQKQKKDGELVQLGTEKLWRKLSDAPDTPEEAIGALDRKKNYILSGKEPFLVTLGISDKDGRVHDKRQAKFRQINRFLEILGDYYENLPKEGTLHVLDLCSGKSYLSFAVYHYLTAVKKREVSMLAVDLKEDVIRYCTESAASMGYDGMHFLVADITKMQIDTHPHLVISLHACDTATDVVLQAAVRLGARMILSTPCCHRELSRHLSCEPLSFVSRYGKLSDKLCEAMTDGLRLLYLSGEGYRTNAMELTDPDDTPKNTLLCAVKEREPDETIREEYGLTLSYLLGENKSKYKG